MIKKLSVTLVSLFLIMAVSVSYSQEMKAISKQDKATELIPSEFPDKAPDLVGQTVTLKGMVVHVCKHGGKKMFIVGENPDIRVKIDASDKVTVFDPELEGNTIWVEGTVAEIEEEVPAEETGEKSDADHENFYHKRQYSISCLAFKVLD
jgi:hypothetical protein